MISQEKFAEYSAFLDNNSFLDNICVVEGTIPVLISVPHAVPHMRDGREKSDEVNTDVIGLAVNAQAGCHLFINDGVEGDPNHDENNVYKEKLLEYVRVHGIAMVIDLHGASQAREFDFELGTAHGRNVAGFEECVDLFRTLPELSGKIVSVDEVFPASAPVRVSSYISANSSVPSLQIEVNRRMRAGLENVNFTSDLLSRYIRGLAHLLACPDRADVRLMWATRTDGFRPRNLVYLPSGLKGTFVRNENVGVISESTEETLVIKGFEAPDGCVAMSGHMLTRCGCEGGHVLMRMQTYATHKVLKPQAEDIDNVYALLSDDLYEKYKAYDLLEVLNPRDNLRAYFKIRKYEGNVNGRTDAVWLSYFQRKLLGIEAPHRVAHDYMLSMLSHMSEEDRKYFESQYKYDKEADCYVRIASGMDSVTRLRNIWNAMYGGVRFRGVVDAGTGAGQNYLMERLIRKKTLQLRVARCADSNEIMDAVFISKGSSIILGVSELDYIWISNHGKKIRTKVIIIDKDDYHSIVKTNTLQSEDELDMLVCIPMKLRAQLGVFEPGTSVMVERSVWDIFEKNAFSQMMTLLGLFIAVMSMPYFSFWVKVILFLVSSPFLMYTVLAGERNKI